MQETDKKRIVGMPSRQRTLAKNGLFSPLISGAPPNPNLLSSIQYSLQVDNSVVNVPKHHGETPQPGTNSLYFMRGTSVVNFVTKPCRNGREGTGRYRNSGMR